MNKYQGRSLSKNNARQYVSESPNSYQNSKEYIPISKELNIPIESVWQQKLTIKRNKMKLFESPLLNNNITTTKSFTSTKNDEDILSKLMKWDSLQIHLQDNKLNFKEKYIQNSKMDFSRNQYPKTSILRSQKQKFMRQNKTKNQAYKVPQLNKYDHFDISKDCLNQNQQVLLDPQTAKRYAQELDNYVFQEIDIINKILPKLQIQEKIQKQIAETNLKKQQRRAYSVIDQSFFPKFEELNDTIQNSFDQQSMLKKRRIQIKKRKLKLRFIFVLAVVRISKKYRTILKERASVILNLDQQKIIHEKYIDQFGIMNIKLKEKAFVEGIFSKLNSFLQDSQYIKECELIQKKQDTKNKDLKKQRFCQFVSIFLQILEIVTKQDVIPPLIIHQLNLNFFKTNNTQSSLFVINRAPYYDMIIYQMTKSQQLLIATEYLIFSQIIPRIFEIFNEISFKNLEHRNSSLCYLTAFMELIQIYFVDYFGNLDQIRDKNVKPIQRIFELQIEENKNIFKPEIIYNSNINQDETIIIEKSFDRPSIKELQNQKPYWDEKMKQKFSKIISNIEQLILTQTN